MSSEPKTRRSVPIRVLLTGWYLLILVLITLCLSSFLYYRLHRDLSKQVDRMLTAYASDLGNNLSEYHDDALTEAIDRELRSFRPFKVEFRAFDELGGLAYTTSGWDGVPHPRAAELGLTPGPAQSHQPPGRRFPLRVTAHRVEAAGSRWLTQTALPGKLVGKTLGNYVKNMLYVACPLLLFGLGGGWWLSGRALTPVARMAAEARRISSSNHLHELSMRGAGDELDDLAAALNDMLARLHESFTRIERFSTQLAHELRTPITQLMGETEAALLKDLDAEALRALLAQHAETYQRLQGMLADLMTLLRSGVDRQRDLVTADLQQIVREVVEDFNTLAEAQDLTLIHQGPGELSCLCDPPALRRLLGNLLQNAMRHTPAGGRVQVSVIPIEGSVRLVVEDTGTGIDPADLPHVFERFYRGRRRPADAPSYGLGLSLVKEITARHGGQVHVESDVGRGTRFIVTLPITLPPGAHGQS